MKFDTFLERASARISGLLLTRQAKLTPTAFYLKGTSRSRVAPSLSKTMAPAEDYILLPHRDFEGNGIRVCITNRSTWERWDVLMAAPLGLRIGVGEYLGAYNRTLCSSSEPRLRLESESRKPADASNGSFRILQLVIGANKEVISFAADFVQHDERRAAQAWSFGSIRINSTVPLTGANDEWVLQHTAPPAAAPRRAMGWSASLAS